MARLDPPRLPKTIPVVGMGATKGVGSDCYPYTVVSVISPTKCVVVADLYRVVSGSEQNGSAEYEYAVDPNGYPITIRFNSKGVWKEVGHPTGSSYYVGNRRAYRDPHF